MNINNDLESFNVNKCNERFENFLKLHDVEVKRLTQQTKHVGVSVRYKNKLTR